MKPRLLNWPAVWISLGLLLVLHSGPASSQSCPSICICKWKNGKRWVECKDQGQISIPDKIDTETQVLDLSGNNLQILPREVFSRFGLVNLQRLYLSNCKIGQIDPTAFRGLTNLVELNLAGNLLTAVPTATFSDIPYLRELRLSDNPLQKLEANAFEMIPQLVNLDLTNCNIKKIAVKAFANLQNLEKLYLGNNSIKEIRQKTVESIAGVHGIELSGNPWLCDCRLRALKEWLVSANVPQIVEPSCAAPARLENKQFAELNVDEFACAPDLLAAARFVEANSGENATIVCKVGSVPRSTVKWYRDGNEILNNSMSNRGLQKIVISENGTFESQSTLTLTNVRTDDSGQYKCVASNPAGKVEANFTLQVGYFVGGVASLESGEIAGIAVTFSVIAVVILVVVLVFLVRHRTCTTPFAATANGGQRKSEGQANGEASNANGFANGSGATITNPFQKPPRITELTPYTATGQQNSNGSVLINGTVFHPTKGETTFIDSNKPIGNSISNPDLIPANAVVSNNNNPNPNGVLREDSREDLGGFSPGLVGPSPSRRSVSVMQQPQSPAVSIHRQSRQIVRPTPQHAIPNVIPNIMASHPMGVSDNYYPRGSSRPDYLTRSPVNGPAWSDDPQRAYLVPSSPSQSPIRRDANSRTLGHAHSGSPSYSGGSPYRQQATLATKTLPRFAPQPPTVFSQTQSPSMYLSEWQGAISDDFPNPLRDYGYPSDYGLPLSNPGHVDERSGHVTVNPMTGMMYSDEMNGRHGGLTNANMSNSSGSSSTLSPLRNVSSHLSSSGIGDTSAASGTSTIMMGYDTNDTQATLTSSGGTPTPTSGTCRNPSSWLKSHGGVQVLPPTTSPRSATSKSRLFKSSNRDSPDEGIQDDCSTDV